MSFDFSTITSLLTEVLPLLFAVAIMSALLKAFTKMVDAVQ